MATCAEGVESREQLSFLRSEGCTEAQGYLYSKPQPASEIRRMLDSGALKTAATMQQLDYDEEDAQPLLGSSAPGLVPAE
jgi:predicted signal transduction protein with EAL and GGDEF domain